VSPYVGAGIVEQPVAEAEEPPRAVERERELVDLLARMVAGAQVLLAILDPADRAPEPDRAEGNEEVLGVELPARPESAADVQLDGPGCAG
jgi:hypothetical protein